MGKHYFWQKTHKSFFLPYSWYIKAKIFLEKRYVLASLGFKIALNEKLGWCKKKKEKTSDKHTYFVFYRHPIMLL